MTVSLQDELISFCASSLCPRPDNVGILKHAITFHSKIRHIVLGGIFYLHPQTSPYGIWLIIKYWNVSVCHCDSNHIHACDPGSQVTEELEKKERAWDYKRKECVEAECFDKYFVLLCATGDTITGPEPLPSCWITHQVNQYCWGSVDWKSDDCNPKLILHFLFWGPSCYPMWFNHIYIISYCRKRENATLLVSPVSYFQNTNLIY